MKYILQIFTGPWQESHPAPEEIIRKIESVSARIPVESVIIGWNTDASLYQKVGAFLHSAGIRMLLWLPVFSEISDIAEPETAVDLFGDQIVAPIHQEGEDFLFCCPSSSHNLQAVKNIYETYFSGCCFDGVFLDKIRSQSFVAGVSGVLSCGCPRCRRIYQQKGLDPDLVTERYQMKKDAFFDMAGYPMDGAFQLKDPLAQQFFAIKEEIITDAVADLSRYFKSKDMIVGLDLFAPVVSRFVGQNYTALSQYADFIKPMLYRKTTAPAGIGYEYALFESSAPAAKGRMELSMNGTFLNTQLEAIQRVSCAKYPGIEINYRADIAKTDPAYITRSLTAIKDHGFDGAALCWNILLAPDPHIDAVSQVL
ncbi:MAG: putative glycoside hydrolase [Clostridiales bacterium]|nr:putative glycoside hydrolase [Clostridiales bacterium]